MTDGQTDRPADRQPSDPIIVLFFHTENRNHKNNHYNVKLEKVVIWTSDLASRKYLRRPCEPPELSEPREPRATKRKFILQSALDINRGAGCEAFLAYKPRYVTHSRYADYTALCCVAARRDRDLSPFVTIYRGGQEERLLILQHAYQWWHTG